ncbi:MAG: hypothetical protein IJZ67_00390 [Alistipes sp.]|nr:hypothetical protein [Alistipes sp.]
MYPLETIICCGALYALYRLLLEGRISHSAARAYLTLSVLLSAVIPMLELPILPDVQVVESVSVDTNLIESDIVYTEAVTQTTFDWTALLLWIYIAVAALLFARFVGSIVRILRLRSRCSVSQHNGYYIAVSSEIGEPFSFGRTIFLGKTDVAAEVIVHERSHISHYHTLERLIYEAARCCMWFNPFVHLIAKSAAQVCEWQADSDVISRGFDINNYRKIIFHQLFGYSPDITCGLNSNLTKKRFLMMTKIKTGRYQWLRLTAVIPVVVVIVLAFGAVAVKAEVPEPKNVVEIRKGGEQILLNSKPVTLNELPALIEQTDDRIVTIDAEADVPMGKVTDVKESLRGIEHLKINYAKPEVKQPEAQVVTNKSHRAEPQSKTVKARNLLQVAVTADGDILLRGEKCSKSELKREVKRFVQNYHVYAMNTRRLHVGNLKKSDYSDFSTTALTMPNGDRVCCPVSNGIVSVTSDSNAAFDAVQSVLTTINEAYYDLRQNLSRRVYSRSYDKLDPDYRQMINNAIPTRVYMAEC